MANSVTVGDSILLSVKKLLNIAPEYDAYDVDLIILINTFLQRLRQVGIGSPAFELVSEDQTWRDFLVDPARFSQAKTYVYVRTRLIFDPPQSSAVIKAYEDTLRELEVLLNIDAEHDEEGD